MEQPSLGMHRLSNVSAMFCLTRDLTPLLVSAATSEDPARVINIGSMEGLHIPTVHGFGSDACTAIKAAEHHLTRHLAVELGPTPMGQLFRWTAGRPSITSMRK